MIISFENAQIISRRLVVLPVAAILFSAILVGCSSSRPSASGWGGRVENSGSTDKHTPDSPQESQGSTTDSRSTQSETPLTFDIARAQLLDILSTELQTWIGTPHVLGGTSFSGVDCSGLVQTVYRDALNVSLPRTTGEQEKFGKSVRQSELETGDLVFFKPNGSGRHVGIFMNNGEFIHASSSRGVARSNLGESYWDRYYHKARRVFSSDDALREAVSYAIRMADIRDTFQSN